MANSIQTCPYEILLRFNCERGEAFGQLRGCHRAMASYVVDDAGTITGRVEEGALAADFPPEQLVKYLGEQFAAFNAQLEAQQMAIQGALADGVKLRASLNDTALNLTAATELNAKLSEHNAELQASLTEVRALLTAAETTAAVFTPSAGTLE